MLNSIGNKIATARKKMNLSQAELAQFVSISAQAVGKWERGESTPDITTLSRLAEILGVDLNYFAEQVKAVTNESESLPAKAETGTSNPGSADPAIKKRSWDMSLLNLADSDFSGLNNIQEKFSSSNMQRCLFVGADLSDLLLNSNNVDSCDFTNASLQRSRIHNSNLGGNSYKNCNLQEASFSKSNILSCDFSAADFTGASFKTSNFMKNTLTQVRWNKTAFVEMQLQDLVLEGTFEDCSFENCGFYNVKFQQATLINTFFKNNRRFKRVQFIDCKADRITYAFLKSNQADLTGVTLLETP